MKKKIRVKRTLTDDGPRGTKFDDVYDGIRDPWYQFAVTPEAGVDLMANRDGFEWLARYFLKLARTEKHSYYHNHWPLDMDDMGQNHGQPELTVYVCERPEGRDPSVVSRCESQGTINDQPSDTA